MTRKIFLTAIVLSLATGCTGTNVDVRPVVGTSGQQSADDVATSLKQGKSEFAANNHDEAILHFRKALNSNPNSIRAMNGLAASYDKLGRFDLAAPLYKSALTQAPESAATLNNIGYSHYLQKKLDVALIYLKEAASRDEGDNPLIRTNLRIVNSALLALADEPAHSANRKVVSASHKPGLLHPGPKQKKAVRLVRSGLAMYTLYTRPMPDSAGTKHAPADKSNASLTKSSKMRSPAAPKSSGATRLPPGNIVAASGTNHRKKADRMVRHLKENGLVFTAQVNADDVQKNVTTIFYKPGQENAARAVSKALHYVPRLIKRKNQKASLYVELGADLFNLDRQLIHTFKKQTKEANHVEL